MEIWLAIGFVALAMVLLSVRLILRKNGRFSSQHISESPLMKRHGIHCATAQDREARRVDANRIDAKNM